MSNHLDLVTGGLAAIGNPGDGLTEAEKKRRQWGRSRLDPGAPGFILADEWVGPPPTVGMPAAFNATAMLAGQVIASPSQTGYPVAFTVASVTDLGKVVLTPVGVPPSSFRFVKGV